MKKGFVSAGLHSCWIRAIRLYTGRQNPLNRGCDHANAFKSHPLMIHVHSMKIRFPCPDNVWQKDNVMSWAMAKAEMPQLPSLLEASRSLISKCEILPGTSNFVAWILLHALISISWALVSSTTLFVKKQAYTPRSLPSCGGTWHTYVRGIFFLLKTSRTDLEC